MFCLTVFFFNTLKEDFIKIWVRKGISPMTKGLRKNMVTACKANIKRSPPPSRNTEAKQQHNHNYPIFSLVNFCRSQRRFDLLLSTKLFHYSFFRSCLQDAHIFQRHLFCLDSKFCELEKSAYSMDSKLTNI